MLQTFTASAAQAFAGVSTSLTRCLTHDRAGALSRSKPDCDVDDQELTEIVSPHTDEETPTAEQVAGFVAGIPASGKACEALLRAGRRARIAGNRITVNDGRASGMDCRSGASAMTPLAATNGTMSTPAPQHISVSTR